MSRITIREVAQRAGVSHQTVSRVLNNSHEVAAHTRDQVQRAIAELNYHPNAQAVNLSRNRSNIVGVVVHTVGDSFFSQMVEGAYQSLARQGRSMLLIQADEPAQPSAVEGLLRSRQIDGLIIILPLSLTLERTQQIAEKRLPVVLLDLQYDVDIDYIAIDNTRAAYVAAEHLLKLGHRRIGMISGGHNIPVGQLRENGYQEAHCDYAISCDPALIYRGDFTYETGIRGTQQLLDLSDPPTAIFASNDWIAFGVFQEVYRRGLRIPQDLAIVGFDDIPFAAMTSPALTTMRQPLKEMGRLAGEHICRILDGTANVPLREIFMPELVVRQSCGAEEQRQTNAPHQ